MKQIEATIEEFVYLPTYLTGSTPYSAHRIIRTLCSMASFLLRTTTRLAASFLGLSHQRDPMQLKPHVSGPAGGVS